MLINTDKGTLDVTTLRENNVDELKINCNSDFIIQIPLWAETHPKKVGLPWGHWENALADFGQSEI